MDLAGNVILDENQQENNVKDRNFVFGVGLSYKPQNQIELYGNVSQNYRSVTFNDIRTVSPSNVIDPNISDEKDLLQTLRGQLGDKVTFDASIYVLYYNDKIGSMKLVTQMDLLL
jgi:Fe(3+) dicitrate transport protein